jgi:hypothetical protein
LLLQSIEQVLAESVYEKNLYFILEIKTVPPKIVEVPIFHNPKLQPLTYKETLETMTSFQIVDGFMAT